MKVRARGTNCNIRAKQVGWCIRPKENLHKAYGSPWSDDPAKGDPEFTVPQCYYAKQPPSLYQLHFQKVQLDTLFYIFYRYNRGWFYHREQRFWLMVKSRYPGPDVDLMFDFAFYIRPGLKDSANSFNFC
ncbi:putative NOT transcription complex subunit VIP2 isoform X2 [Apium graveolens]|uniref:putative NOT transcription complex subunit VIP2 isoform X2 n=1 Tax=Apium graveolens TaxID=4045 RepID=UPI003D7AB2E1